MEVAAHLRSAPISAQKCRLVANQIRRLPVHKALDILSFSPKKAAHLIKKVLESVIANAEHNEGADIDDLYISTIYVNEAATHKRMRPRAKGRSNRILKRTCHITVKVSDEE